MIDAAEGIVQVEVTPDLRNPAGTWQGSMVALLAEAAADDLMTTLGQIERDHDEVGHSESLVRQIRGNRPAIL